MWLLCSLLVVINTDAGSNFKCIMTASVGAEATLDKLIGLVERLDCMEAVEILKKAKGIIHVSLDVDLNWVVQQALWVRLLFTKYLKQ